MSCMLNTACTVSGAPSAYKNCAHGSTYVRFGSTTRKPYDRRSRSTVHGFSCSLPTDSIPKSSLKLLRGLRALVARRVRDGLMLDGRRDGTSGGVLLKSDRLASRLHDDPDAPL